MKGLDLLEITLRWLLKKPRTISMRRLKEESMVNQCQHNIESELKMISKRFITNLETAITHTNLKNILLTA